MFWLADVWALVQKGVWDLLTGDQDFLDLCGERYYLGEVGDEGHEFPFVVTRGEVGSRLWMTHAAVVAGEEFVWPMYFVGREPSSVRQAMGIVQGLLHLEHFDLGEDAGWRVIRCMKVQETYPHKEEEGGGVWVSSQRYEMMLEEDND